MQDGIYQVHPEDLIGASDASLGHAKYTQGMIEEMHGEAQRLSAQYQSNASLKYVTDQLGKAKKIAQNSVDAHTAHHTAHLEAHQIAIATENKNLATMA